MMCILFICRFKLILLAKNIPQNDFDDFNMADASIVFCIHLVEAFITEDEHNIDIFSSKFHSRSNPSTRFRKLSGGNFPQK